MADTDRPPLGLLLTIDVSNTQTHLAVWPLSSDDDAAAPLAHWLVGTHPGQTADEHRLMLSPLRTAGGLNAAAVGATIIACEVPDFACDLGFACR